MKMRYEDLLKGLEFALNYHGIDADADKADFRLAAELAPQIIHGAECAKRGLDPAMTPLAKTCWPDRVPPIVEAFAPAERKPTPVEALAERLAKVEDRLDKFRDDLDHLASAGSPSLDGINRELKESFRRIDQRIDKVVEIIGERVGEIVNDISAVVDSATRAHERLDLLDKPVTEGDDGGRDAVTRALDGSSAINAGWWRDRPNTARPYFPTGGASTAEAATDAVLPVPQRGDRVRLEGAETGTGQKVPDGWFDVIGSSLYTFQVRVRARPDADRATDWLPWLGHEYAKEVRHADHT